MKREFRRQIDVLGSEWTTPVSAAMLDPKGQPALQALVEEAAALTGAPMAIVSLLLNRTQVFHASTGLPADLATSRATDRDVSFCQCVVRDGASYETEDAQREPSLPQELVQRYGIRAYLGAPVVLNGRTGGSLCVIDTKPRSFTAEQRSKLEQLAERASSILQGVAHGRQLQRKLHAQSLQPVFGETRNALTAFSGNLELAQLASAELEALVRLGDCDDVPENALEVLRNARSAHNDLQDALQAMDEASWRVSASLASVQASFAPVGSESGLVYLLQSAHQLARHQTKLLMRFDWPTDITNHPVVSTPSATVNGLATCLTMVANAATQADGSNHVSVEVVERDTTVGIQMRIHGRAPVDLSAAAQMTRLWFESEPACRVEVGECDITIQMRKATANTPAACPTRVENDPEETDLGPSLKGGS